ncbi:MAG: hypothetical protein WCG27_01190 [Pseudomonadota bacterium]
MDGANEKRRYAFIGLLLFVLLAFSGLVIQGQQEKRQQYSFLKDGIQTCFNRSQQSYTAKMLGSGWSNYLKANFMKTTEECLGDVLLGAEKEAKSTFFALSSKKIANLAANTHWFHEKLNVQNLVGNGENILKEVNTRFGQLEKLKNQIIDELDGQDKKIFGFWPVIMASFYLLILVIPWWVFRGITYERRRADKIRVLEQEASSELEKGVPWSLLRVEKLVRKGLEQNQMDKLSHLFSSFFMDLVDGKIRISAPYEETAAANEVSAPKKEKVLAELDYNSIVFVRPTSTTEDELPPPLPMAIKIVTDTVVQGVSLSKSLSKVIDLHSSHLFSQGIQLDFSAAQEVMIDGNNEMIEQVLYQIFDYAINAATQRPGNRLVQVVQKKLGGTILLDLVSSGPGFREDEIHPASPVASSGLALQIAQELAKDSGIQMGLENLLNEEGQISGEKIRMVFRQAGTVRKKLPRLANIAKGRKKDILNQLNSPS